MYANDIKFNEIDTTDANVIVAIIEGDNEIAVMTYPKCELQQSPIKRVRAVACMKDDVPFFDEDFQTVKDAVGRVTEFMSAEYESATDEIEQ